MEVTQSLVNVKGGFNTSYVIAKSISYTIGDTTHLFVQLDKNALWFLKGAGGTKTRKGDLKAIKVLHDIRDKFNDASGMTAVVGGNAAVAGGNAAVA